MNPDYAISKEIKEKNKRVFVIDTKKAKYRGQNWESLSDYQKRKLENLIVLNTTNQKDGLTKVFYQ